MKEKYKKEKIEASHKKQKETSDNGTQTHKQSI